MQVRRYEKADEANVIEIIKLEGEAWESYYSPESVDKFKRALEISITYVAYENEELCGYSRSVDDNACEIIVCDLLVTPKHRGKNAGRLLMECIHVDYPGKEVYVMSDVDEYYEKLGYKKTGSVFEVPNRND